MKISVIIPVYNVKPYLERCVNSVLRQTYKDLEIILVDDGSTDGSGKLCDQIALIDKRIRVIHQENQGPSSARNTGIRQATGEYIIFIDSDDKWLIDNGISTLVNNCDEDIDLLMFKIVDIWNQKQQFHTSDYDTKTTSSQKDATIVFKNLILTQQYRASACLLLVRKRILISNDLFFQIGMISEDLHWGMQLWQHVKKVKVINLDFYGYYHRKASISTTSTILVYNSYNQLFSYWKDQCDSGCINAESIRIYLADMWVSLGYGYNHLLRVEKPIALRILQKHIDLLDYGKSQKSKLAKLLVQMCGVKLTIIILGRYWQIRHI